jgi:Domain of unknown function (DUF4349)
MRIGSRVLAAGALTVAALLIAGCSAGGAGSAGGGDSARGSSGVALDSGGGKPSAQPGGGGGGADQAAASVQLVDLGNRIVRKATLNLEVGQAKLKDTISRATTIVTQHQGIYVSSSTEVPNDQPAHGQVSFRVPVDAFEATLSDLKGLGRYRGEQSSSEDVTTQYIDLNGQLAAWRAQEKVFLRLIGEAKSIGDVITVQNQLQTVQSNINRLQGQVNFLRDQSSFSTIELDLSEPGAGGLPQGRFAKAWSTAVEGLGTIAAAALVVVVWLAPLALVGLIAVWAFRRFRPPAAGVALADRPPAPN